MSEMKQTPGPWRIEGGQKRGVYVVVRSMGGIYVQYLGANGKAKPHPSNFRSEEAARAALSKAAPKAAEKSGRSE